MSPTGGTGNRHQRLLAELLDPGGAAERDAADLGRSEEGVPRIVSWWEL